jgi:acyl-CoA synthetase (AMP-forming)/AMP-acid ligase II
MNLATWVERHGRRRPGDPALAEGERVHADWAMFAGRTANVAAGLRSELGLGPGERVVILMRNRPEYLEAMFGIWHAGMVAVPVNARLHRDEVAYILEHSGAAAAITDAEHADDLESLLGTVATLQTVVVAPGTRWDRLTASSPMALTDRRPDDAAWLFYTSGTTGRPKGATLTHRNLLMMSLSYFADIDPVSANDCVLHAAPISHGSGLYGLPHIARGAVSVIPESGGADPAEIASLLRRWPGMSFFAAPIMVKRLAADPAMAGAEQLANLKTIIYGGAPMYLADLEVALDVLGPRLAQIYGQGETPMTITALSKADHGERDHPRWRDRLQSVGFPRTDVEVRVVDDDDHELPTGEIGEVVVRGDVVMAGYWEQPDASAETLRGGWLHTGDMGSFDEEGFLTLRDRSKDLIISGGMNIYPREVEEALLRHPGVKAVSVVGRPDPEWGEAVVAFVVADDETAPPVEELDRACLDTIARFKRPKDYRFVDALPTNNYGKVLKRELRERLTTELGDTPNA